MSTVSIYCKTNHVSEGFLFLFVTPNDTLRELDLSCYASKPAQEKSHVFANHGPSHASLTTASLQVGPGVKSLYEGDSVLLLRPFAGTWATATVCQERTMLKLPKVRHYTVGPGTAPMQQLRLFHA